MEQKKAYLDCSAGISGTMLLAAFLDAGLPLDALRSTLAALSLQGCQLELTPFHDRGVHGSRMAITLDEQVRMPAIHRLSDVTALLQSSPLSPRVQEMALAVFRCLAEAEASVRGKSLAEVHLHALQDVDALIAIVGAAAGMVELGITQLYSSALPLTSGHTQTAYGLSPVPSPVTLEILRRVQAPWRPCSIEGELVTPVGAALLAALTSFNSPPIVIERTGYGFGDKHLPWPDCLRLSLGTTPGTDAVPIEGADTDWVAVIESHIDNMTGELLGGFMERLFAAGALDVSYTPLYMKKNRPATLLTVICPREEGDRFAWLVLRETSTLGVRIQHVRRLKAQREQVRIMTPLGAMLVKIKRLGGRIISTAPEYEECQRIAKERQLPLAEVYEVAQRAISIAIIQEE